MLDNDAAIGQLNDSAGDDVFNFVAVGANFYFVPESHAAKFTVELGVSLNETSNISFSGGDTGVGVLGTPSGSVAGSSGSFLENTGEDGQIMISATMQWLF